MSRLHRLLAVLTLAAGALAAVAQHPRPGLASDEVSAVELAEWIRARKPGLLVLDLRPADQTHSGQVPGAQMPAELKLAGVDHVALGLARPGFIDPSELNTIVIYGPENVEPLAVDVLLGRSNNPPRLLRLHGGIAAWNAEVLFPSIRADASERQRKAFAARAELSRYFSGSPRVLDPGEHATAARSRQGC